MKQILLTRGLVAIVDDQDYQRLSRFKWYAACFQGTFYAVHKDRKDPGAILIHRLVLYAPRGMEVDHRNGDTLDNRRQNLRLATHAQNLRNRGLVRTNTNGYKGIRFCKQTRRWHAQIMFKGKYYHLGCFDTPELAAKEYNRAAKLLFREFARLNVIAGR